MAARFSAKRPAWVAGCALFLALLCGSALSWRWLIGATIAGVFLFVAALAIPVMRRQFPAILIALFAVCTGLGLLLCQQQLYDRPLLAYDGQTVTVAALVEQLPDDAHDRYVVRVTGGDLPAGTRAALWMDETDGAPACGDLLEGEASVAVPQASGSLRADGIGLYLFGSWTTPLQVSAQAAAPWWQQSLYAARDYVRETIGRVLSGDTAGLAESLCIGQRSGLSAAAQQAFRRSGVYHLLAVSGFHLSVVTMGLMGLWRLLRLKRRWQAVLTMPFVLAFMLLTGGQPSVVRAGLMALVMLLAMVVWRETDGRNSLGLAMVVMGVINPYAPCDAGLQLSVAATVGILLIFPPLRAFLRHQLPQRGWRPVIDLGSVSVAAWLPTLPLTAWYFGQISLVGVLTGFLCIYPATGIILLDFAALLTGWLPWLSGGFLRVAGWLCDWMLAATAWMAQLPFAVLPVSEPYLLVWVVAALALLLLGWKLWRAHGVSMAAALAVIVLCVGVGSHLVVTAGTTGVTVCRTDGAAVLMQKDGHTALLFAGDQQDWEVACRRLERQDVRTLDVVVWLDAPSGRGMDFSALRQTDAVACLVLSESAQPWDVLPPAVRQVTLPETGRLTFWNDCAAQRTGDFWLLTMGATRLLVCPPETSDAQTLPADFLDTDVVIYRGKAPQNADGIAARQGAYLCAYGDLADKASGVPYGRYPITVVAETGDVTFSTRGRRDITVRG